jgi:hypothetical protein
MVAGDRLYEVFAADTRYPASGWHIRGEMGGFWTPPIKLLDGLWFSTDNKWLGPATRTTSSAGYVRSELPTRGGVRVSRVDFVPDGLRAALIGLTFTAPTKRKIDLTVDAHSELMSAYPWGETKPSQLDVNLPDTASYERGALVFRDSGKPPGENMAEHDWAAVVAGSLNPTGGRLGPGFRGPQEPPVICAEPKAGAPKPPQRCDDSIYGRGAGGSLRYTLSLRANLSTTVWFTVAGSDRGVATAVAEQEKALADPEGLLARKFGARRDVASRTVVDLPGDQLLESSVEWSKQNLADSVQEARRLQLRSTAQGNVYPPAVGALDKARWFGAGFPDYPWLFGTDGEYTAFAAVAAGQFEAAQAHLRALKDVSEVVNRRSGKVIHEVMPDGSVYFGTNAEAGNTDETAKFPSAVALLWRWTADDKFRDEMYDFTVRNMRYVLDKLDADGDGWPEGLGNVERAGMGEEKLDNAVYTIRGLRDLADLALSRDDQGIADWASAHAAQLEEAFEDAWWLGEGVDQYADSLDNPSNTRVFQRHWTGLTPLEAVLVRSGRINRPVSSTEHGRKVLDGREKACYSGALGLYHTGTGPTSAAGGNRGPACDKAVSTVQSERSAFSLNTAVMAVAEGNYGRLGRSQQQRYTTANARIQLDRALWEMPGAMPEIAPGGDFGANIDKPFTDRSMVLQAWGAYGVLWPVVHQQLGVNPDIGRDRLTVVPQVPDGQPSVAGRNIRIGSGSIDVGSTRDSTELTTKVTRRVRAALTFGAVLPAGAALRTVRLDGKQVQYRALYTSRGVEVVVDVPLGTGTNELVIRYR